MRKHLLNKIAQSCSPSLALVDKSNAYVLYCIESLCELFGCINTNCLTILSGLKVRLYNEGNVYVVESTDSEVINKTLAYIKAKHRGRRGRKPKNKKSANVLAPLIIAEYENSFIHPEDYRNYDCGSVIGYDYDYSGPSSSRSSSIMDCEDPEDESVAARIEKASNAMRDCQHGSYGVVSSDDFDEYNDVDDLKECIDCHDAGDDAENAGCKSDKRVFTLDDFNDKIYDEYDGRFESDKDRALA